MEYFYMYILQCNDGSYYIGHTDNLEKRIAEDSSGFYKGYTFKKLPVYLVYNEKFETREEAFAAERKVKKWSRDKREALIKGDFKSISLFAKKKFKDVVD